MGIDVVGVATGGIFIGGLMTGGIVMAGVGTVVSEDTGGGVITELNNRE